MNSRRGIEMKLDRKKIKIELYTHQENTSPYDVLDEDTANSICEILTNNLWAWCCVEVQASIPHPALDNIVGLASLGCCSYEDVQNFIESDDSYTELKNEAIEDLEEKLIAIKKALQDVITEDRT